MSKSRFDNLELERPAQDGRPRPKLSRFEEAAPAERAPEPVQHGVQHDIAPALQTNRFAGSGDDGVVLELADDSQPFRRCLSCQRDSTRYETRCKVCGTQLDSPEAIAFNDELWKRMQAERVAEKAEHAQHDAEAQRVSQQQHDALLTAQRKLGHELAARYDGDAFGDGLALKWRIGLGVTGAVLLSISWQLSHFSILRAVLGGAGLLMLIAAVPGGTWLSLGRPGSRRWWF